MLLSRDLASFAEAGSKPDGGVKPIYATKPIGGAQLGFRTGIAIPDVLLWARIAVAGGRAVLTRYPPQGGLPAPAVVLHAEAILRATWPTGVQYRNVPVADDAGYPGQDDPAAGV